MATEDQKAFIDQLRYGQSFMLDDKRIDPKDIYMDKQEPVACECHRCIKENNLRDGAFPLSSTKMVLCHECGNKRCPKASDHRLACTGSNESGQAGSIYTAPPKPENELDAIERAYFAGKQAGIAECEAVKLKEKNT
jgi:hypothetical protein